MPSLASRRRARELESSKRAGAFSRAKARDLQLRYAQRNWRFIAALAAVIVTLAGGYFLLFPEPQRWLGLGLVLGVGAMTIYHRIVIMSGSASMIGGDLGEQWTRDVLRRLRRKRWRFVYGYTSDDFSGDIDTVAIGPGGIVVVETKWSASAWNERFMSRRVGKATVDVSKRARLIRERLGERFAHAPAHSVVVLWSPMEGSPPVDSTKTDVVNGRDLPGWLENLGDDALSREDVDEGWRILEASCASQALLDPEGRPLPRSLGEFIASAAMYPLGGVAVILGLSIVPARLVLVAVAVAFVLTGAATIAVRHRTHRFARFVRGSFVASLALGAAAIALAFLFATR